MNRLALTAIFLATPLLVNAGGIANNYEVDHIRADKSGRGYVYFKKALETPADCSEKPGFLNALAFDTNTSGGKSILSIVLTAKASGKLVYAKGTGLCETYANAIEDWSYGMIKD